ncbi:D-inositol 3-phosphate glycosyltransferase [Gemmata obscuriglobus]|nr:D-inositol 3-phosphate glycosyltransferase [Gemmata obscuriglobus]VTS02197.1 group 1 glycosyl transferase : Glycosyl transferase, group 1 family protein OS=Rhodopirellula sp. SWK7 GN=RRSWK_02643 PE=4 SV=1: Glyco_trans_4_4: Glycos_transf_1 [Gemmata obscuriglobus UQM 2246]
MDIADSLSQPFTTLSEALDADRPPEPPAPPVVLDARVVTGAGGGPEKTILNSPRFLEPLGYKMVCAYMHPPGDPGFEVLKQKAERYRAPLVSIPDRGAWDWRVISQMLAVCKRERVTVWHGHDYKTNALGLLLKRLWPMRLVTTVHGWVQHTSRTPLYYRIDQLCIPRYERVICVSDDLLEECLRVGVPAKSCVLLENGIDTAEYARRQTRATAKAALGLPPDGLLIGAVGRLSGEKGFDVLIRSVHQLVARGLDARLVIVGEGGERGPLEALIRELDLGQRVRLAGWQADVRGFFEAMDVFALSSLREGLPNVLLEAMALEVPVVSTRVNGVPRLVQDGRNGFLVNAGDLDGLTRALAGLLKNDGLREMFRAAGRRTVETRYSFATRMQRLARLYDELLAR